MNDTDATVRLWQTDHPYYCTNGNYFVSGLRRDEVHTSYDSWAEFLSEWGDADHDMNLVFRWDWKREDRDNLLDGEEPGPDRLFVFWVLQRKAILRSTECTVTEADEPAARAWLASRAKMIAAIWTPFLSAEAEASADAVPGTSPWQRAVDGLNVLADADIPFHIELDGHIVNPLGDEHIAWDHTAGRWVLTIEGGDD
ncbi:hypothetical protein [Streptomyces sp. NPDC007083]|uniref:hypothetical protein n=1 Tax=Streptomyces sp. NPDC007083 TaxID=3156913 RepID=UPI0033F1B173